MFKKSFALAAIGAVLISAKGSGRSDAKSYTDYVADFELLPIEALQQKINDREDFVVYIGRASCPYCQLFVPKLHAAALQEQIALLHVDSDAERANDVFLNFRRTYGLQYVPALLTFRAGNLQSLEIDSANITVDEIRAFIQ